MKNILILIMLSLFATACFKEEKAEQKVEKQKVQTYYTCSMHPQIKQETPGDCPICGMGLTKVEVEHDDHAEHSAPSKAQENVYYCESDPSEVKNH